MRRERAPATWAIRSSAFDAALRRFNSSAAWARLIRRAPAIPSWVVSRGHSNASEYRRYHERWTRIRSPTVTGDNQAPLRARDGDVRV